MANPLLACSGALIGESASETGERPDPGAQLHRAVARGTIAQPFRARQTSPVRSGDVPKDRFPRVTPGCVMISQRQPAASEEQEMAQASRRHGLTLAIVVAALVGCGGASAVTPSATTTPTETAPVGTPTPTPTVTPTPTLSPSPSQPAGTPSPTLGAPGAHDAMQAYADALVAGQYEPAWKMLGPGCQGRWGSLSAFTKDRAARMKTAGPEYTLQINPKTLPLASWLIGTSWAREIDQVNSYLFSLKWAGFGSDPRGTEIWIVNPAIDGWLLYLVN